MDLPVHKLIAKTAFEMAAQVYDDWCRKYNGGMKNINISQKDWANKNWHGYMPMARKHLAQLLGMPHVTKSVKEEIHEALVLDNQLQLMSGVKGHG